MLKLRIGRDGMSIVRPNRSMGRYDYMWPRAYIAI